MIALVRLGWRMAVAGGRQRMALVTIGNVVGTALLLFALRFPSVMTGFFGGNAEVFSKDDRRVALVVGATLLLPILVLIANLGWLAARGRQSRLASLRLLGVSPRQTRVVAATENAVLGLAGAALGAALYGLLAGPVGRWLLDQDLTRMPLKVEWLWLVVSVPVVLAVQALVGLSSTWRPAAELVSLRSGHSRRTSWWWVAPLGLGLVIQLMLLIRSGVRDTDGDLTFDAYAFLVGTVLTVVGLLIALVPLTWSVLDLIARRSQGATGVLAARRAQSSGSASVRVITGLVVAVFIGTGSFAVLEAFKASNGQYTVEQEVATDGPQLMTLIPAGKRPAVLSPQLIGAAREVQHVTAVLPRYPVMLTCDRQDCELPVMSGSCRDLKMLFPALTTCAPDRVTAVQYASPTGRFPNPRLIHLDDRSRSIPVSIIETTIPPVSRGLGFQIAERRYGSEQPLLFVPETLPGLASLAPSPREAEVLVTGGLDNRRALETWASGHDVYADGPMLTEYERDQAYRRLILLLIGLVVFVGLVSVALTAIDQLRTRRQANVRLTVVGTPRRALASSQLLQVLVPTALGLVGAVGTALLCGQVWLTFAERGTPFPASTAAAILGGSLVSCLIVAGATSLGVGGRVTAQSLRRE